MSEPGEADASSTLDAATAPTSPSSASGGSTTSDVISTAPPTSSSLQDSRLRAATRVPPGLSRFRVLEHVWDIDWYLRECHRLLVPGGWLILSTHGVWPYHPHPTDYRRWTGDGLQAELESRGLKVIAFHGLIGPLGWTTQIRALGFRHVLLKIPVLAALAPAVAMVMNLRIAAEELLTPDVVRQENASVYVAFCRRSCDSQTGESR